MAYEPPGGSALGFDLTGYGYVAPDGNALAFNFQIRPPYVPPIGSQVPIAFGPAYQPPPGSKVGLEFVQDGEAPSGDIQYVFPVTIEPGGYGSPVVWNYNTRVGPSGIHQGAVGSASLHLYTRYLDLQGRGIATPGAGRPAVFNWFKTFYPAGFAASAYGRPTTYNLRQYITGRSFDASSYGTAFLMGGVKYITPSGHRGDGYGRPALVNTTADKAVRVSGIPAPPVGSLSVSPRTIRPVGSGTWAFGTPWLQRNPSPLGFDSMAMGQPAIEYWTKYLRPSAIASVDLPFPIVFDPTQTVYPPSLIRSAVFGDIAIINQSRYIRVLGADYFEGSDWAQIESNRRDISVPGLLLTDFGSSEIRNRWPTIAPVGFDALHPPPSIETGVGYSLRYLRPSGIYRTAYGRPVFTKTPDIAPEGFIGEVGEPAIWFRVRNVDAHGHDLAQLGDANIWFRYRHISAQGYTTGSYGSPKLEHSIRTLLAHGAVHMRMGSPKLEALNRTVSPASIFENFATDHMVGTDRWLRPVGFDASRFGARIIPEIQSVYPLGFTGLYGEATVWNMTQQVSPAGYLTVGLQPADRWGTARAFNLLQHITMQYDAESQLNPPAWSQWTMVENRSKVMRSTGSLMARIGIPQIDNNARPILPLGIDAPATPEHAHPGLVAYRIRYLPAEAIEAPYLGRWNAIYNDAAVIAPSGMVASLFGMLEAENNRRFFPYITGGDLSAHGTAMVADRIRTLTFESRYGIAPPFIRLPEVKLYTRYVEPEGLDLSGLGAASLSIHWQRLTPRWTHQEYFGWETTVRNVTPEVGTRGRNAEEYGDAFVRLEWRPIYPHGAETVLHGRSQIAYRDRILFMDGFPAWRMTDKHVVTRTGAPPYSEQAISLERFGEEGDALEYGYGINPADERPIVDKNIQVPEPALNQSVIYVEQEDPGTLFGNPLVRANTIRPDGKWHIKMGEPFVSLKIRYLEVAEWLQKDVPIPSNPRMSPLTIWAVKEPPPRAVENHPRPVRPLHYINERPLTSGWIKGMGRPRVTHYHRIISPRGYYPRDSLGVPLFGDTYIFNRRSYIRPEGMPPGRIGWQEIPGDKIAEQFESVNAALYGRPSVEYGPYLGPQTIRVPGVIYTAFGSTWPSLYNRSFNMTGFLSERMGTRRQGDTPYAWRGLRVGPLMPTIPEGFAADRHGDAWVSRRVRGVEPQGYDAFASEYEFENFHLRMRVRRYNQQHKPVVRLAVEGFDAQYQGTPDVMPGIHYIRPDGNSDQYRKGAF